MLERVRGPVRGAQDLDIEPLEQRAGSVLGGGQLGGQLVVGGLGVVAVQLLLDAEDLVELVRQPYAAGRAAEEVEVLGEGLPDLAMIRLDRTPISPRDAQRLQGHALGVEHAENIMVGDDEQVRGRAEGRVLVGQQRRIDVAVRRYDWQSGDTVIELACHAALSWVCCEETIRRQKRFWHVSS